MDVSWDKTAAAQLRQHGLSVEQVGAVLGQLAEHRQRAYHAGYKKGYEDGFDAGRHALGHRDGKIREGGNAESAT